MHAANILLNSQMCVRCFLCQDTTYVHDVCFSINTCTYKMHTQTHTHTDSHCLSVLCPLCVESLTHSFNWGFHPAWGFSFLLHSFTWLSFPAEAWQPLDGDPMLAMNTEPALFQGFPFFLTLCLFLSYTFLTPIFHTHPLHHWSSRYFCKSVDIWSHLSFWEILWELCHAILEK